MQSKNFDTLSQAVDSLTNDGYKEDFEAEEHFIIGNFSRKEYQPEELKIIDSYRFEGETDPQDQVIVFAIEASDGAKGTLVMAYGAEHSQNHELIKKIQKK